MSASEKKILRKDWTLWLLAAALALALLLLAPKIAEKQCDVAVDVITGGILLVIFAWLFIPICNHFSARNYGFWALNLASIVFVGALGFYTWPQEKITIITNFKTSPLFTTRRKAKITHEMNCFYIYLKALGFAFPAETPLIGTSKNIGTSGFSTPGTIYEASIYLQEETIDDSPMVTTRYAMYLFDRQMVRQDGKADPYYTEMSWVFPCYYGSSFSDRNICKAPTLKAWFDALWDIRTKYGQQFTDKMMYYAFATRQNVFRKHENFNSYFLERLTNAMSVLGNSPDDTHRVLSILKQHGIYVVQS